MIRIFNFLLIFILQVQVGAQSNSNCNWGAEEWNQFLQNDLVSSERSADQILELLDDKKASCSKSISSDKLKACTARAEGYYSQFTKDRSNMRKHMFSSVMTNDDYIASQPRGVLELPEEFKNSSNGLPDNWEEIAAKNGWKWVLFKSDTGNEPRLVFYIPGEKWDRLVVYYSLEETDTRPSSWIGVQMQAIEKKPKSGGHSDPPKYYFKSWNFEGPNRIPEARPDGGRCVQCHVSGPRAVVPKEGSKLKTRLGGVSTVNEFNELILRYGELDYSPYYDMKHFPKDLQIGEECMYCHNGKNRQSLAFSINARGNFYEENIHRKVVREGTMPAGSNLSDPEREKMYSEIKADYRSEISACISGVSCVTGKPKGAPSAPEVKSNVKSSK